MMMWENEIKFVKYGLKYWIKPNPNTMEKSEEAM
jgi:hypothetical protein